MEKKSFPLNLDYLVCVLLITATLAVFWQVRHHNFVNLDDPLYVTENSTCSGRSEPRKRSSGPLPASTAGLLDPTDMAIIYAGL